jgi:hypothetical protein
MPPSQRGDGFSANALRQMASLCRLPRLPSPPKPPCELSLGSLNISDAMRLYGL